MSEPTDLVVQPEAADVVSLDELKGLIVEQALDMRSTRYVDGTGDDEPEEVILLDPLVAYAREAARMRRAGPRRRSVL